MNLLISEPLLQILLFLAMRFGLNATILQSQSRYRLPVFNNVRDRCEWIYKTYEKFQLRRGDTISRGIRWLKYKGDILSTA